MLTRAKLIAAIKRLLAVMPVFDFELWFDVTAFDSRVAPTLIHYQTTGPP